MKKLISTALIAIIGSSPSACSPCRPPADRHGPTRRQARRRRAVELVLVADDDDDDTNDDTNDDTRTDSRDTGSSRDTNDNTNSRFTGGQPRPRPSRGDKTRDWTRDGGDRTRDWSANQTNDRSRNDTRR